MCSCAELGQPFNPPTDSGSTHRLRLLSDAAAETNPELSHPEADKEAAAVSSQLRDVSRRPPSCLSLPEPQTQESNTMTHATCRILPVELLKSSPRMTCQSLHTHTNTHTHLVYFQFFITAGNDVSFFWQPVHCCVEEHLKKNPVRIQFISTI